MIGTMHKNYLCILDQKHINLLGMAGRFIDQRCKGQERIISIRIANKEVILMQM